MVLISASFTVQTHGHTSERAQLRAPDLTQIGSYWRSYQQLPPTKTPGIPTRAAPKAYQFTKVVLRQT
jgi:hypothetical protein